MRLKETLQLLNIRVLDHLIVMDGSEHEIQTAALPLAYGRFPSGAEFTLRVQPSGVRSYYARFFRNRRLALGRVDSLSPDEARERCQRVFDNLAHGPHPLHGLDGMGPTLRQFIRP